MLIEQLSGRIMSSVARSAVARFRYGVFVQDLQWTLPCKEGAEQDEFDTTDATHIVAYSDDGAVMGYARLLPTDRPYLLATHFPHLLNGQEPPCTPFIWELSRFAAGIGPGTGPDDSTCMRTLVGKRVLLEAVKFGQARECRQLVFCTTVAIERLARRWGVDVRRLGRPCRVGPDLLVALSIECTDHTIAALVDAPRIDMTR